MGAEKFEKYFRSIPEVDKIDLIKNTALCIKRKYVALEKARQREFESEHQRSGIRGGTATTITANAMNARQAYNDQVDMLKIMMRNM